MQFKNSMSAQSTNYGMGTIMAHRAFGKHAGKCLTEIHKEAVRIEDNLSRFLPGSEISRISRSAGIQNENLGYDTYEVLSQAVEFSRQCHGYFDVTIGAFSHLME